MADRTFSRPDDAVDPMAADFHDGLLEKPFMEKFIAYARNHGWRVFHDYDPVKNESGLPDLIMTNGRFVYFVELKSAKGRVSKKQQAWLDDLDNSAMHLVRVWKPEDWPIFTKVIENEPRDPQPR